MCPVLSKEDVNGSLLQLRNGRLRTHNPSETVSRVTRIWTRTFWLQSLLPFYLPATFCPVQLLGCPRIMHAILTINTLKHTFIEFNSGYFPRNHVLLPVIHRWEFWNTRNICSFIYSFHINLLSVWKVLCILDPVIQSGNNPTVRVPQSWVAAVI